MTPWPEFDTERLQGTLLRVDLYEQRYLAVGEYPNVLDHLLRCASAACLCDREGDAIRLLARASVRVQEWVDGVRTGRVPRGTLHDLAAARAFLAAALIPGAEAPARTLLDLTDADPAGAVHNARLAAALIVADRAQAERSAGLCELSDAGLGLPWKKAALAILAKDEAACSKAVFSWIDEKIEATMTHEWGAYNEVPIEVSGALALAEHAGLPVLVQSNRVLTRFRP